MSTGTNTQESIASPLFSPDLISAEVQSALPAGYKLRPLTRDDYRPPHSFLDVLRELTHVGDITEDQWNLQYDWMSSRSGEYFVLTIEEEATGRCVGVGSLVVERKFLRNLGSCGHIEDVVVLKDMRGKQFGLRIIQALDYIAEKVGCYKAILDCSEHNAGFYVKCGFMKAGVQMAHYFGSKPKA